MARNSCRPQVLGSTELRSLERYAKLEFYKQKKAEMSALFVRDISGPKRNQTFSEVERSDDDLNFSFSEATINSIADFECIKIQENQMMCAVDYSLLHGHNFRSTPVQYFTYERTHIVRNRPRK